MSKQTNALRQLFDGVWNGENPDVADELVGPEYVIHDRELAAELRGPALYNSMAHRRPGKITSHADRQ